MICFLYAIAEMWAGDDEPWWCGELCGEVHPAGFPYEDRPFFYRPGFRGLLS